MNQVIPHTAMFQFAARVPKAKGIEIDGDLSDWPESSLLPNLFGLQNWEAPVSLRAAWSEDGLWFGLEVDERTERPKVNPSDPSQGDALELLIDTRDVRTAHRAGRFCHGFSFLPATQRRPASVSRHQIARSTGSPPEVDLSQILLASESTEESYTLEIHIPSSLLHGYDPEANRRLGLAYRLHDKEQDPLSWPHSGMLPVDNDPSFWAVLELVE